MIALFAWVLCCACGGGSSGGDDDGASGSDSDADSDSGSDGDSDSDADSDSDGDCSLFDDAGESFAVVYDVGPGQEAEEPGEVPWESLEPGTLVRIHHRPEPYAAKWVINTVATAEQPLVVRGVPDGDQRPVISGENATTRVDLDYWNENRSVIKIGGSSLPSDDLTPAHVRLENLEIRSARPAYQFTDDGGSPQSYSENAAAVHVERGDHVAIVNCVLTDSGNGLFTGHGSSNVLVSGNQIHSNGIEGSYYEHNSYTESLGITFQYNHYGPLRDGCGGNNLKDRSAGTLIRYNWLEGGNRQLDLVESDYDDLVDDPSYDESFVYGNVLVEPDGAGNSQIVHYGGDGGDESMYRSGTLHFYHNTLVSTREGNTTLLRLSTNDLAADVRNNVLHATAGGEHLAACTGTGQVTLSDNWLPSGWRETHESSMSGGAVGDEGNLEGDDPGLADEQAQDYSPAEGSPCLDAAGPLADGAPAVGCQYELHQGAAERDADGAPDIGAFER